MKQIKAFPLLFSLLILGGCDPDAVEAPPAIATPATDSEALFCALPSGDIEVAHYWVQTRDGLNLDELVSVVEPDMGDDLCEHVDTTSDDGLMGVDQTVGGLVAAMRTVAGVDVVNPTVSRSEGLASLTLGAIADTCSANVTLSLDGEDFDFEVAEIVDGKLIARRAAVDVPIFLQDKDFEVFEERPRFFDAVLVVDRTGATLGGFVEVDWLADVIRQIDEQLADDDPDADAATLFARSTADNTPNPTADRCERASASIRLEFSAPL